MGWFSKSAADYVNEIVSISHEARKSLEKGDIKSIKRFLEKILKKDEKELIELDIETGAKELTEKCVYIHSLAEKAIQQTEVDFEQTKKILKQIEDIELQQILTKIKKYQEIKKELKKRKFDIDRIGDSRGFGIDPLIKPLVATLVYFGIKTEQSCHGHLDHGEPHPWVRIVADSNFDELIRTIRKYNENKKITWSLQRLTNPSELASSVAVMRSDRKELTKEELDFIAGFCIEKIKQNKFSLKCVNMNNYWIAILAETGSHHEDIRKVKQFIEEDLTKRGYEVDINIPKDLNTPDTYNIHAQGGTLEEMQKDIIHLSDYIIDNFKRPHL